MPAYNFQARFAPLVRSGAKTNTIRGREAKVGGTAYLYTGQRTKACECLGQGEIKSCLPVRLGWSNDEFPFVALRSERLTDASVQELAVSEGFADGREMVQWFMSTYKQSQPTAKDEVEVYAGFLISWTPTKQGATA